jgi:hypothetical protein
MTEQHLPAGYIFCFFRIDRMKGVPFSGKEVGEFIPVLFLKVISEIAEVTSRTRMPGIRST